MKAVATVISLLTLCACGTIPLAAGSETDPYEEERESMVRNQIEARDVTEKAVLSAMRTVKRHALVPDELKRYAYRDRPLPIGHGQTISQPYIVALMTELLELEEGHRVLEVGTGSGYQAAVLEEIVDNVISIEIIRALADRARKDLGDLGYDKVKVIHGDGYFGYEDGAPYDAIIVTAAAEHIPPPLVEQLKPGGRMVIPVNRNAWTQNLILLEKKAESKVRTRNILPVRFVPLTREKR